MQYSQERGVAEKTFRSELLGLRRRMLGLSQVEVAEASGISQGTLSKIEQGLKLPAEEQLQSLAQALACPPSFFFQPEREYGPPMSAHAMFRKKAAVGSKAIDRVVAELNVRIAHIRTLLQSVDLEPELPLPQYSVEDFAGGAEEIACYVRKAWYAPRGPVKSLTEYVERAGVVVVHCDLSEAHIDGVSYRVAGLPPIIFLNQTQPGDRLRFTLAHELGHLIMHAFPEPEMEQQANEFASALLMPREDIVPHLRGLTLERAAQLKPYWKVSMAGLMMAAKSTGSIDEVQSQRLWKQYSFRRYRLREPAQLDFPAEQASIFPRLLQNLQELGYSPDDIVAAMHLGFDELSRMYGLTAETSVRGLRLVGQ